MVNTSVVPRFDIINSRKEIWIGRDVFQTFYQSKIVSVSL